MRRADKEITDRKAIEDILRRATVCRLGLCHEGHPYVVPLSFGYKDNHLYFHSAPEGKKIEILKTNPHVCFEVDVDHEFVLAEVPCSWTVRYRSVVGFGQARLVESLEEKRSGLDAIMAQYSYVPYEYPAGSLDQVAVFEVRIETMTGKQSGY